MKVLKNSILVPSISVITGLIAYLILSGTFFPSFNPLSGIVEATSYGSFSYVTNMFNYETTEVSYNMEDMYNSTHLYDFSEKGHFGRTEGSLEQEIGLYGQSLRWPSGQIIGEDLDIVDMSFTLEAWIYPASNDPIALAGCETTFPYILKAQNGTMQYQYSGGPSVLYSNQPVGLNAWTHVALVYDAISGIAKWYLNGSEQGSKSIGKTRDWDGRWAIGRWRPDHTLLEWNGKIDEFRIYKDQALTQSQMRTRIQADMSTSIAHKLILYGLTPNYDVAQLWYPNGEFARDHMLEQTADTSGQVEFNVYSFSGGSEDYNGILKVVRSGRTYTSPLLEFSWRDVYFFSIQPRITETQIAISVAVSIALAPSALLIIYRYYQRRKRSGTI
ncbi:MAG: LamG domain-containing protein [Candidatus Hodarchaeota archaeon]